MGEFLRRVLRALQGADQIASEAEVRRLREKLAAAREGMAAYKAREQHIFDVFVVKDARAKGCAGCQVAAEKVDPDLCCERYEQQTKVIALAWARSS